MSALGTGVTGGEPLLVLDRVVEYASLLKEHFGPDHHIHLYTALRRTAHARMPAGGWVDEIRLHPPHESWPCILDTDFARSAALARRMGIRSG